MLEAEIDQLVYQLDELAAAEIAIIEGCSMPTPPPTYQRRKQRAIRSSGYENLAANTFTQIILQIAAPAQAGVYSGTLTLRWDSEPAGKLVVPLTIVARADPTLALQDPTQITMKATQGSNIVRRVVLHEATNGSPLTKVQSLTQDLVAIDGAGVLAASQINVNLPSQQIAGGGFLTATVNINLQRGARWHR